MKLIWGGKRRRSSARDVEPETLALLSRTTTRASKVALTVTGQELDLGFVSDNVDANIIVDFTAVSVGHLFFRMRVCVYCKPKI